MRCPKGCTTSVKIEAGPEGATYSSVQYRPAQLKEYGDEFACPSCHTKYRLGETPAAPPKKDDSENRFWLAWLCAKQFLRPETNYHRNPWWLWRTAWVLKAVVVCLLGRIWIPKHRFSFFGHEHYTACMWDFHSWSPPAEPDSSAWLELQVSLGWRNWHAHIIQDGT